MRSGFEPPGPEIPILAACLLLTISSIGLSFGRRFLRRPLVAALAIVLIIFISRCSAGGGGGSTDRGTPAGTYIIQIQATSGSLSYGSYVTLIVM